MKNLIFYGAPAAGKGTQCELLVQKYGYESISMGELFRNLDKSTPLGKKVNDLITKGSLVDDQTTSEILQKRLSELKNKSIILDGFPRNINQAILLNNHFDNYIVININVQKEVALKRVLGRINCENCKKIYNIYNPKMIPKNANTCDICGGKLISRSDDNEKSFNNRFDIYLNNVKDILDYYRQKKILYEIDSKNDFNETYAEIENILKEQND